MDFLISYIIIFTNRPRPPPLDCRPYHSPVPTDGLYQWEVWSLEGKEWINNHVFLVSDWSVQGCHEPNDFGIFLVMS